MMSHLQLALFMPSAEELREATFATLATTWKQESLLYRSLDPLFQQFPPTRFGEALDSLVGEGLAERRYREKTDCWGKFVYYRRPQLPQTEETVRGHRYLPPPSRASASSARPVARRSEA